MRKGNGHLLQRQIGNCKQKGALIGGEKGKGHFYYVMAGTSYKVKGALLGYLDKRGNCILMPPSPTPEGRLYASVNHPLG